MPNESCYSGSIITLRLFLVRGPGGFLKKFVKVLIVIAILYLLWAVVYSVILLPGFIKKVKLFKTNGSSIIASRFYSDSFVLNITKINQSVLNAEILNASDNRIVAYLNYRPHGNNKQTIVDSSRKITRSEKNWSIESTAFEETQSFKFVKRIIKSLPKEIIKYEWHPLSEAKTTPSIISSGFIKNILQSFAQIAPLPVIYLIYIVLIIPFYPVNYLTAYVLAFSPSFFYMASGYLITLAYLIVALFLAKGLYSDYRLDGNT